MDGGQRVGPCKLLSSRRREPELDHTPHVDIVECNIETYARISTDKYPLLYPRMHLYAFFYGDAYQG